MVALLITVKLKVIGNHLLIRDVLEHEEFGLALLVESLSGRSRLIEEVLRARV